MRRILILFVLIVAGIDSRAGRSSISGHITSSTGMVLDSVLVRLTADGGWQFDVRSDASGYFSITGLDFRHYTATISRRGFESQRFVDIVVNRGTVSHLGLDASLRAVLPKANEVRTLVYNARPAQVVAPGHWMARQESTNRQSGRSALKTSRPVETAVARNTATGSDRPATKGGPQERIVPAEQAPALLTAVEINDFSKWFLWDEMSNPELDAYRKTWKIRPENRVSVLVKASNGMALPNADVSLLRNGSTIWEARTDNTGKAELWYDMFRNDSTLDAIMSLHVRAAGAQQVMYTPVNFDQGINTFTSTISCVNPQQVDVAFIVDATGSMGQEIAYLKSGLRAIFNPVARSMPLAHVQTAAVFYRDRGEEFLVRSSMLSDSLHFTENFIASNDAAGGGDGPEALESALAEGLRIGWRTSASARLAFLMLDAPPHEDSMSLLKLEAQVRAYAARGIRLIPIVSNRADKSTGYLLRSMALATNGTCLFLSDRKGGEADPETGMGIIDTAGLNQLVYRVIRNFSTMPECENQALAVADTLTRSAQFDGKRTAWKLSSSTAATDLQVDHDEKSGFLYVSDVNGKLVQRIAVDPSGHSKVDMKKFPAGMYSIRHAWGGNKQVAGTFELQR